MGLPLNLQVWGKQRWNSLGPSKGRLKHVPYSHPQPRINNNKNMTALKEIAKHHSWCTEGILKLIKSIRISHHYSPWPLQHFCLLLMSTRAFKGRATHPESTKQGIAGKSFVFGACETDRQCQGLGPWAPGRDKRMGG